MSQTPSPHDNMNIQKTLPVDSKGAAIDDVLRQFRQYLLHGIMSDTPHQMTFDEAVEAILAILAQEVKRALEKLKLMTDYNRHFCTGETLPKNEQWVAEHKLKVQGFNEALKVMEKDIDKAIERLG